MIQHALLAKVSSRFQRKTNYVAWTNYKEKIDFLSEFYFDQARLKSEL
jgi:hypothetical protein